MEGLRKVRAGAVSLAGDGGAARECIRGRGAAAAEPRPGYAVGPERHPALRLQQLPQQRRRRDRVPGRRPRRPRRTASARPRRRPPPTRLERVFAFLQSQDIRNVELYGYPGNPFPGTNPATALNIAGPAGAAGARRQVRPALPRPPRQPDRGQLGQPDRGLEDRRPGPHRRVRASRQQAGLQHLRGRAAEHRAAAQPPRQALGRGRPRPGVLPQPPASSVRTRRPLPGQRRRCKSAWEIVMDRTDARWVVAQIDIGWAVCGSAYGTPPDAAAGQA